MAEDALFRLAAATIHLQYFRLKMNIISHGLPTASARPVILIHAHDQPEQLNRLIRAVSSDDLIVYVNLDRKSRIDPAIIDSDAKLIKNRIDISWGNYTQVQATLNSLEEIFLAEDNFSHIVFISGQDYPVWRNDRIVDFLQASGNRQFLHHTILDHTGWAGAAARFEYYYYNKDNALIRLLYAWVKWWMQKLSLKRTMVDGLTPYGGSQWFILTRDCAGHVLNYVKTDTRYAAFMKSVECVDEIFFQTLLCNSEYKPLLVNDNLRYIDWSDYESDSARPHPNWLTQADFESIAASDKMFCRKMHAEKSLSLMDALDTLRNPRTVPSSATTGRLENG